MGMKKFYFWNDISGLELGVYEGKDAFEAYSNLLIDAGYNTSDPAHTKAYQHFLDANFEERGIQYQEVEERYFISIDNVEVNDTIEVFDGFEHRTLEDAKQVIHDLKSDPENEYTYRIYKGHVTSYDKNEAALKAYVLQVL